MEKIEFKLFMLMLATVMSFSLGAMDDESYPSECEFENSIEISGWPNLSYCQYDDEYASESLDNSYEREMSLGRDTVKVNDNGENKNRYVYLGLRGKTMCFKCLPPSCSPMVLTEELSTNDEKYGESPSTASSISSEESEDSDDYEYTNCQRAFKCKYAGCSRSFDRKSHLNAHLMAHTGEKLHLKKQRDYKCSIKGCAKG